MVRCFRVVNHLQIRDEPSLFSPNVFYEFMLFAWTAFGFLTMKSPCNFQELGTWKFQELVLLFLLCSGVRCSLLETYSSFQETSHEQNERQQKCVRVDSNFSCECSFVLLLPPIWELFQLVLHSLLHNKSEIKWAVFEIMAKKVSVSTVISNFRDGRAAVFQKSER